MEIEFGVVFKMARGRGTRDGEELELSVKSNKTCKSSLACFLTKMARGCGTRVGVELPLNVGIELSVALELA